MFYQGKSRETREAWRVEHGEKALDLMESQLTGRAWLAGSDFTIADIALIAYTHVAHEGGFDLSARRHLRSWIARCGNALAPAKLD
jgi:glutathione S-transferase